MQQERAPRLFPGHLHGSDVTASRIGPVQGDPTRRVRFFEHLLTRPNPSCDVPTPPDRTRPVP